MPGSKVPLRRGQILKRSQISCSLVIMLTNNNPSNPLRWKKSLLFLPAHRLERFERAMAFEPDMICVDLEDGLPADKKIDGRQAILVFLKNLRDSDVAIRTNSPVSELGREDLRAIHDSGVRPFAVILPMISDPVEIQEARNILDITGNSACLIAMIETATSICLLDSLCAALPENSGLLFGNVDMALDIGCENSWESLIFARTQLVLLGAKWRLPVFDGPTIDLDREDILEQECLSAKSLGFCGKAAIHPKQVGIINKKFQPSLDQLEEARKIVSAYEQGPGGAVRIGEKMVDHPVYRSAIELIESYEKQKHSD